MKERPFPDKWSCTAWEDCAHDGICHDPKNCGAIGPNHDAFYGMTDDTPPVLYISADTSDLTTRYKATPRMHPRAEAWIPRDAVRVKPLEWDDWSASHRIVVAATSPAGVYRVTQRYFPEEMFTLEKPNNDASNHATLEAAKAAAQADYEARIMSALAALPAPDEGEQGEGE